MNNLKTFKQFLNENKLDEGGKINNGLLRTPFNAKSLEKISVKDDEGALWKILQVSSIADIIKKYNERYPHDEKDIDDWEDTTEKAALVQCVSAKSSDDYFEKGQYAIFVESQYDEKNEIFVRQY
jgi:hypothetical protein